MKVQINPDRLRETPKIVVLHPVNRRPFPAGVFEMSESDQNCPHVTRLFAKYGDAGGRLGGVMGDLHLVIDTPASSGKKA